jgi:signal transduction histidine kinase
MVLYGLFGFLDHLIFPEYQNQAWFIRYAVVCPVILACLLFTYSRHFKHYMQAAVFFTILVGGAGIVALMVVVRSPINYFHYAGLLLVLMYTYTFSKLRFLSTTAASWSVVVLYELASFLLLHTRGEVFLNDNFFYVSANIIGMFSSYNREYYMRRDFLQNRTVRELEEKKHLIEREKILRDLHDGLGGITTNIRLLAEMGLSASSPADVRKTLGTISDLAREGLAEIKGFLTSMDQREISWNAFSAELRTQGNALLRPHGISFDMQASPDIVPGQPGSLVWLNLLRIYKEALTNVIKHSQAKKVSVSLDIHNDGLVLNVGDDGRGLGSAAPGGRGMTSMRKRAEEIGAVLTVTSEKGTQVHLSLPLPHRYPSRS